MVLDPEMYHYFSYYLAQIRTWQTKNEKCTTNAL